MATAKPMCILVTFCVYVSAPCCAVSVSQNTSSQETNSSCVQAEAEVSLASKNASCVFYTKRGGVCESITINQYIFDVHGNNLEKSESYAQMLQTWLPLYEISEGCKSFISDLYCRYLFPLCDTTLSKPLVRPICRKTCKFALEVMCKSELPILKQVVENDSRFDKNMVNCTTYPADGGGKAPECYQYSALPGDKTRSSDCYYGNGIGYRGNVNITRSGLTCQRWTSQCPHRHWRVPEDVDGQNNSNVCRNPDGSAPDGPWCYTADPKVRWEYCNISRCPPRVPAEGPNVVTGYPLSSSVIYISWESMPPSSHKEQLLGYRIKYRRLGSQVYNEMNVTSNVTEAVVRRLDYQTKYEFKVNGFNEIGHGPPGKVMVVKTLQLGEILINVNFTFVIDADFHSALLNSSGEKFRVMEEKIGSSIKLQFKESSEFKIHEVRVLSFRRGSVKAHVEVSLTVNELTSRVKVITRLVERFDTAFKERLGISALFVAEKPPPPGSLRATNVQAQYIILTWDKPQHGSSYRIHNYTVERKNEGLDSFIMVKTLPYSSTGRTMKGLKPSTEYTIRLSSNNKYGKSDGILLTQGTLPDRFIEKLMLTIVLPLGLAVSFIVIVYLKFRQTCQTRPGGNEEIVLWKRGNWLEIPRSDIQLKDKLGEGAFGEVFKGVVRIKGQFKNYAVKKLKENAAETEKRDLRNELQIMATVGEHPNLISLIGACTEKEPVLVVVRLAENGCLLNRLQKNRENPYINVKKYETRFAINDRVRIARDIANGMLHLSNKKCVHRDLAARNVLLDEKFVAMVSDFGLSRDVYESGEYENTSGGLLPVRWMAPESLMDYTYNTKTDVWSFGIVLWEIESGGVMPYSGLGGMEVVDFLKSGQRLKQPDGCPDNMYEIMTSCWHLDNSQRPSFSKLVTSLEQELKGKRICLKDQSPEYELTASTNQDDFTGCTDLKPPQDEFSGSTNIALADEELPGSTNLPPPQEDCTACTELTPPQDEFPERTNLSPPEDEFQECTNLLPNEEEFPEPINLPPAEDECPGRTNLLSPEDYSVKGRTNLGSESDDQNNDENCKDPRS